MTTIENQLRALLLDTRNSDIVELFFKIINRDNKIIFSQAPLCRSPELSKFSQLHQYIRRFNGLCDVISNAVIMDDLLGNIEIILINKFLEQAKRCEYKSHFEQILSIEKINQYSKTHILYTTSYFQQIMAYVYSIYPDDVFHENRDNIIINQTINQEVFEAGVEKLPDGFYLKCFVFTKKYLNLDGHVIVIKKTGNTFSFFDPNEGETYNLNIQELCRKINITIMNFNATNIVFLDGRKFLKSHSTQVQSRTNTAEISNNMQVILSVLKNITQQNFMKDAILVEQITQLHTDYVKFHHGNFNLKTLPQDCSQQYFRDQTQDKLDNLEEIRCAHIEEIWKKQLQTKIFQLIMGNHGLDTIKKTHLDHDFLYLHKSTQIIYYFNQKTVSTRIITANSVEFRFLIKFFTQYDMIFASEETRNNIMLILSRSQLHPPISIQDDIINQVSLLKTPYDLAAVISVVPIDLKNQLILALANEIFPTVIQNFKDLYILFKNLHRNTPLTTEYLFNTLKPQLVHFTQTAYDVKLIFSLLAPTQRDELFTLLENKLPNYVNHISDLGDLLLFFNQIQRTKIFELVKYRLQTIIFNENNTGYDFNLALQVLTPEQRKGIINAMFTKANIQQKTPVIETIDVLSNLFDVLPIKQHECFTKMFFQNIVALIQAYEIKCVDLSQNPRHCNLIKIITKLPDQQWNEICNIIFKHNHKWISECRFLRWLLSVILIDFDSQTKGLILLENIAKYLPNMIFDANEYVQVCNFSNNKLLAIKRSDKIYTISRQNEPSLPIIYRNFIYDIMKDHIVNLIKNEQDLCKIMMLLTKEQRKILHTPKCVKLLAEQLKELLSQLDANIISTSILTQNSDEICHIMSKLSALHHQQNRKIYEFWKKESSVLAIQIINKLNDIWKLIIFDALEPEKSDQKEFTIEPSLSLSAQKYKTTDSCRC